MSSTVTRLVTVILLIRPITSGRVKRANPYCDLMCGPHLHTLCEFAPCKLIPNHCGDSFQMDMLTPQERLDILDLHNTIRNNVNKRGGVPNSPWAPHMTVMSYDLELEFIAQCYANMCKKIGKHDKCRKTSGIDIISQNAHWVSVDSPNYNNIQVFQEAIGAWTSCLTHVSETNFQKYSINSPFVTGFNMLADTSNRMGCGKVYADGVVSLYCNYGPGIIEGGRVIKSGTEKDLCVVCDCKSKYETLCGKIVNYNDTNWEPPFEIDSGVGDDGSLGGRLIKCPLFLVVWLVFCVCTNSFTRCYNKF